MRIQFNLFLGAFENNAKGESKQKMHESKIERLTEIKKVRRFFSFLTFFLVELDVENAMDNGRSAWVGRNGRQWHALVTISHKHSYYLDHSFLLIGLSCSCADCRLSTVNHSHSFAYSNRFSLFIIIIIMRFVILRRSLSSEIVLFRGDFQRTTAHNT